MRRFENAKSEKFWSFQVDGSELTMCSGRLGGSGHTKTKKFGSNADAQAEAERLIRQRLSKGFEEVDNGASKAAEPKTKTRLAPRRKVARKKATRKATATARKTAEVIVACPAVEGRGLVLGIGSNRKTAVAVGGQGRDLVLFTDDGQSWRECSAGGGGLRGACIDNDQIWVAGEYGFVARSQDQGETWTKVASGSRSCLFAVVRDRNHAMWTAGDGGFLAVSRNGGDFETVAGVGEYIGRITRSSLGILVPTDGPHGYLYVCDNGSVRRTALKAGVDLMQATVTPKGALVVVGADGHVHRSADDGNSFEKIEVGTTGLLTGINCYSDGRVVIVGAGGSILISNDDAQSFEPVAQEHTRGYLWCVCRHGDSMLIGGEKGLILQL